MQRGNRIHRDVMINNICDRFHAQAKANPSEAVNFREIFQSELFGLSMKQVRPFLLCMSVFSPYLRKFRVLTKS